MADNRTHTTLDLAVLETRPLKKTVMFAMFKHRLPTIMDVLPVGTAKSLYQESLRLTDPGDVHTRNLGGDAGTFKAQFGRHTETLKIIHDTMRFDPVQLEVDNYVQDPVELQLKVFAQTIRAKVNDLFINGDPTAVNSDPAGLDFRFNNDALLQGQSVNANGLDVDGSDANMFQWLDHIDEAIDLANGEANYAVMNRQTFNKFRSILRRQKLFDTTKDQFDRSVMVYNGTKFVQAGMKAPNQLSPDAAGQVIGHNTHTSIFGTATSTPIYFCNTGGEEGVRLLQLYPMRVKKIGINPNNTAEFVIDMSWPIGFLIAIRFAVSSVQGLVI